MLYMAPMEGVTGYVYRNTHHAFFITDQKQNTDAGKETVFSSQEPNAAAGRDESCIAKYFTPFVVATYTRKLKSREKIDVLPENNRGLHGEMHVVPQILTNNAGEMLHMAGVMAGLGYAEINLNLGCPVRTVTAKGKGSGFLQYPDRLDQFLDEVYRGLEKIRVPDGNGERHPALSLKIRIGCERPEEAAVLMRIFAQYPMSELIVHPRTTLEGYAGQPHIEVFEEIYREYGSRLPLVYNGNICTAADYRKIAERFSGIPVMLGRGLIANPGLAREIVTGQKLTKEELKGFHAAIYNAYKAQYLGSGMGSAGQQVLVNRMKELWAYMANLFIGSDHFAAYIKNIRKARTCVEYESAVRMLFANCDMTGCADGLRL